MTLASFVRSASLLPFTLAFSSLLACYVGLGAGVDKVPPPEPPTDFSPTGLPCDVATALGPCSSCHGTTPKNGAPMPLQSAADLTAKSGKGGTIAERCVLRMQAAGGTSIMPPGGPGPTQPVDIAALQGWIASDYAEPVCATTGRFTYPVSCTSGAYSRRGEGSSMQPGGACVTCHASGEGPMFSVAGTVFSTYHEQTDCVAAPSVAGAVVVITDRNGEHRYNVNAVGNFSSRDSIVTPYTARV